MMSKAIWWILGAAVAVILMDNVVMPLFVRQGQEFPLPSVVALSQEEATKVLEEHGLSLVVTGEEHSPARLEGTILSQEPPGGTMVKAGRPVQVVVSKGGQLIRLPYLVGVTVRQASLTLADAGLVPGDVEWTYSDSLPPDIVVSTTPEAGELVPKGSRVKLLVNQGGNQDTVAMPTLVGTQVAQARNTLEKLGLELGVVIRQQATDLLPGTVLEQSEPGGTMVHRGAVIDLVVAGEEGDA
jgi:beta-lactam-binding protein with PASTA domain